MLQSIIASSMKIIVFYQPAFSNTMKFFPLLLKGFFLFLYVSEGTQEYSIHRAGDAGIGVFPEIILVAVLAVPQRPGGNGTHAVPR